ncbi:PASTA domain-containing protein [Candidatus Dependentiae bacterium]|nr:PASTA domain-containing protein [Candidatus Dependentiae bacterium]
MLHAIKSFFWIVPFVTFLSGYQFLRYLSHTEIIEVPSVVGMHIHDAIRILSADKLNVRILDEKNDPDTPEGIIISQVPLKGQKVKPHQSIFLVLTRRPPGVKTPSFYGLTATQARSQAQAKGIELEVSFLESGYPVDKCLAQSSLVGLELPEKNMWIYCSSGIKTQRIFPDLRGRTVDEVVSFLEPYGITVSLVNYDVESVPKKESAVVKDQRPIPGSLVDLKKKLSVQLTVS